MPRRASSLAGGTCGAAVAFYRGGAKSTLGVSSARARGRVCSLAHAIWIDETTLRDAPLVGHRGFVVVIKLVARQVFCVAFVARTAAIVAA